MIADNGSENRKKATIGCGSTLNILTIAFVILKLTNTIGWSWWWVLSPTIVAAGAPIVIGGLVVTFTAFASAVALIISKMQEKREADEFRQTRTNSKKETKTYVINHMQSCNNEHTFTQNYDNITREERIQFLKDELDRVSSNNVIEINPEEILKEETPSYNEDITGFQHTMKRK